MRQLVHTLDLHNWRPRHWRPAHHAAGIDPVRRTYDLRHTFATVALRAGLGTYELSRYIGTSLINMADPKVWTPRELADRLLEN